MLIGMFTKGGHSVALKMYVTDEMYFVFHIIGTLYYCKAQAMTLTYNPSHSQG